MRRDVSKIPQLRAEVLDTARPEAVAKRRKTGHWSAQEQIDAITEPADTRHFLVLTLRAIPAPPLRNQRKRIINGA